jgi:hypothetical protein
MRKAELDEMLSGLGPKTEWALIDAPIPDDAESVTWRGYGGTHILEIGWSQVVDLFANHGFGVVEDLSERKFKAFKR